MRWLREKIFRIISKIIEQGRIEFFSCPVCRGGGVALIDCESCHGSGKLVFSAIHSNSCEKGEVIGVKYDGNYLVVGDEVKDCNCGAVEDIINCSVCEGRGRKEITCPECRGTGMIAKFVFKGSQ